MRAQKKVGLSDFLPSLTGKPRQKRQRRYTSGKARLPYYVSNAIGVSVVLLHRLQMSNLVPFDMRWARFEEWCHAKFFYADAFVRVYQKLTSHKLGIVYQVEIRWLDVTQNEDVLFFDQLHELREFSDKLPPQFQCQFQVGTVSNDELNGAMMRAVQSSRRHPGAPYVLPTRTFARVSEPT